MKGRFSPHNTQLPPNPIILLSHKLFVVEYATDFLYATDGLQMGFMCLVKDGQFLIKVLNTKKDDYGLVKMALYKVVDHLSN